MFGFLNVRKPPGPTSHDMVDRVRREIRRSPAGREGVKVGHGGTLDPFAEGVLVVCVGPAVRLVEFVQAEPKQYLAQLTLGATSDTDDPTGRITQTCATAPTEAAVREALARFVGQVDQTPPAYSAVQVEGRRAYKLARKGRKVELRPRRVTIHSIRLLAYDWPTADIDVSCGGGTYIRAIARDVGAALGAGAYCSRLVRTAVGPFKVDDAVGPDHLDLPRDLISPLVVLDRLPKITLDQAGARALTLGKTVGLASASPPGEVAVLDEHGRLIALATVDGNGRTVRGNKVLSAR
jgi:tRNA pseudouridine55 synthase